MDYIKIGTVAALVATTPVIASAGNLADVAVEEVVMAPAEEDDGMMMGSLSSGIILGGLALALIALAVSSSDDTAASE